MGVSKAEHPPAYDLVGVAQRLERFPVEEEAGGPNPLTHPNEIRTIFLMRRSPFEYKF